jgi:hypothetical protein
MGKVNRLMRILDDWRRPFLSSEWRSALCIFGLSTGRCGTTMLSKLLSLSPKVRAFHEPYPGGNNPIRVEPFYKSRTTDEKLDRVVARYRSKTLLEHSRKGLIYVEVNGLKFHSPIIAERMSNSRFFLIHRSPIEYIQSGIRRKWYAGHPWDRTRLKPDSTDPAFERWNSWSQFEKITWLWSATNKYFIETLDRLDPNRYTVIPFADLTQVQTGAWRKLFELIDVEAPAEELAARVLSVKHNEQINGELIDFDRLSEDKLSTFHEIAGPVMKRLGY